MKSRILQGTLILVGLFIFDSVLKATVTPVPVLPAHFQWKSTEPSPAPILFQSFSVGTTLDPLSDQWESSDLDCTNGCKKITPILNL